MRDALLLLRSRPALRKLHQHNPGVGHGEAPTVGEIVILRNDRRIVLLRIREDIGIRPPSKSDVLRVLGLLSERL